MTERELNVLLIETFPEIRKDLLAYMEEDGEGMDTGCFLTHEDVLHPFVVAAIEGNDTEVLRRVGDYIESLLTSHDDYAENVATVGLVEWLAFDHPSKTVRSSLGERGKALYDEYVGREDYLYPPDDFVVVEGNNDTVPISG